MCHFGVIFFYSIWLWGPRDDWTVDLAQSNGCPGLEESRVNSLVARCGSAVLNLQPPDANRGPRPIELPVGVKVTRSSKIEKRAVSFLARGAQVGHRLRIRPHIL